MSNATAWIVHIARVPRNDMDVEMRDRLTGRITSIEADVVAVRFRLQSFVELLFDDVNEIHQRGLFIRCRVKPSRHDSPGDDQ